MNSSTYDKTLTDLKDLYKQLEDVTQDIRCTEHRVATLLIEITSHESKLATCAAKLERGAGDFDKNRQVRDIIDLQTADITQKRGILKRKEALQKTLEEKKKRIQQEIETAEEAAPAPEAAKKCHMSSAEIQKLLDELDFQQKVRDARLRVCTGDLLRRAYAIDRKPQESIQPSMDLRGQSDAIDAEREKLLRELEGAITRESQMKIVAPEVTAALINLATLTTMSIMIAKAAEEVRAQVVITELTIAFVCLVTMDATNKAEFKEAEMVANAADEKATIEEVEAVAAAIDAEEFKEAERIANAADMERYH